MSFKKNGNLQKIIKIIEMFYKNILHEEKNSNN